MPKRTSAARSGPAESIPALLLAIALTAVIPAAMAQSESPQGVTGSEAAATTTALFAHLAIGGGYSTIFTFLNTGSTQLDGDLILTDQQGNPLTANLSDGTTQVTGSSFPLSIKPGGTDFITATPLGLNDPTIAGWARVESTGGTLGGVSTFQLTSGSTLLTIAGVLSSGPVTTATIPIDDDDSARRYTGYAVANTSGTDTIHIKIQTVNADGTTTSPAAVLTPITLGPGKQIATFVLQDPAAGSKFKGSVVLIEQSGKSFVTVALVQNQGLFTAIPVIPARAPNIN